MKTGWQISLEILGLTPAKLRRLGDVPVVIGIDFWYPPTRSELKQPPGQRLAIRKIRMRKAWHQIVRQYRINARPGRGPHAYSRFEATVQASILPALGKERFVEGLSIQSVSGYRPIKREKGGNPEWYAVKARYAIQIEGHRRGIQDYEDRIVMFRARSFEEAGKKLVRGSKAYAKPYLNARGEMVRWQFERILDVYWADETVGKDGAEVWSEMHGRRLKPSLAWLPKW